MVYMYIFSEKQFFLSGVFSLDETNDDQMKANPVAEIDAFSNKHFKSMPGSVR